MSAHEIELAMVPLNATQESNPAPYKAYDYNNMPSKESSASGMRLVMGALTAVVVGGLFLFHYSSNVFEWVYGGQGGEPVVFASANARPEVPWSASCPSGYDFCGNLEFCQSGSSYGFRLSGTSGCSFPGPTIRMTPGNKYKLTLANKATVETNLHTHGLHISGAGDSDDVTRHVSPGMCLSYTWDIGADHSGGTHWYHAHHHGTTNAQVSGGAFGMVVIEDPSSVAPSANVALWMNSDHLLQIAKLSSTTGNGADGGDTFQFVRNQWYRLRVSVVDASAKASTFAIAGSGCTVRRTGVDGIWRSSVPSAADSSFWMVGTGRSDFAVQCTGSVGSSVQLEWGRKSVGTIEIVSGTPNAATPFHNGNAWTPVRPAHLANLAAASVSNANKYDISMSASSINGYSWDKNNGIGTFAWNQVHEWTIGGTGAHPFHLHLYHMQIMSPGGCGDHEEGEFYDTLSASGSCVVRFRTSDIGERCVLHCHVLSHEDNGAMTWIDVQGAGMPINTGSPAEETCGGTPPSCVATECVADFACGSLEGTDNCGDACILASEPSCNKDFSCMARQCEADSCVPTSCTATFECGSTSGTDDCGNFCVASAGTCSGQKECFSNICQTSCVATTCTATSACGSTAGVDDCGNACTATAGTCSGDEVCSSNGVCEAPAPCANPGESCSDSPCCSGTCPGGKPASRKCP